MEAAFIFYINSLFNVPFLCIFMMSILILVLPLSNLRGVRKVKNMIPIVIISVLLLIGAYVLGVVGVLMYVQQAEDPAVVPMVITVLFVVVSVVFTLRLLRNLRVHARMKSEFSRQKLLSDWFDTKE